MNVRHTPARFKGESVRTEPKTSGSKRRIVRPAQIIDLLKEHRHRQFPRRLKAGCTWAAMEAVFANDSGNYLSAGILNTGLLKFCNQAIDMALFRKAK